MFHLRARIGALLVIMTAAAAFHGPTRPANGQQSAGPVPSVTIPVEAPAIPHNPPIEALQSIGESPAPVANPGTFASSPTMLGDPGQVVGPGLTMPGAPVVMAPNGATVPPMLTDDVLIVKFQGHEGVSLEVLGPPAEPMPRIGEASLAVVGLRVGQTYRIRLSNLPDKPEASIYATVQVLGHLHRPQGIDPYKFPVRVPLALEDLLDVLGKNRLLTEVIYLEDPDQASRIAYPKDQIPTVELSPAEDPLRVAAKLGRVMMIVTIGNREPSPEEILGGQGSLILAGAPCPFFGFGGMPCQVACGPGSPSIPPGPRRLGPGDEFLCDGGDRNEPIRPSLDQKVINGLDPRDALVKFEDLRGPHVLPTNKACVYAPRFAMLKTSVGPDINVNLVNLQGINLRQAPQNTRNRQQLDRLDLNQRLQLARERARASALRGRVYATQHAELVVLNGFDNVAAPAGGVQWQSPGLLREKQKAMARKSKAAAEVGKTLETVVVTGIAQTASEQVMSWTPLEVSAVETPPNRPGLVVIKQVDKYEAETGDVLTYTIRLKNLGNVPIRTVSVLDSLLPRLEYLSGSHKGPKGTIFTADPNKLGSMDLRWDLPGALEPNEEAAVSFQARLR